MNKLIILLTLGFLCVGKPLMAQLTNECAESEVICALKQTVNFSNSLFDYNANDPSVVPTNSNTGWFRIQVQDPGTTGSVAINLEDIAAGVNFQVHVFNGSACPAPSATPIFSGIANQSTPTLNFSHTAGADEIYHVVIYETTGQEGTLVLSTGGKAISSPDLVLTRGNFPVFCWGNQATFTNNAIYNGGSEDFELVVDFEEAETQGAVITGDRPTIVSVTGQPSESGTQVSGSYTVTSFPRGSTITVASDFPGTWTLTLRPVNHECFDAQFNEIASRSFVQRLITYRTDENFEPLDEDADQFCVESTPRPNWWYAKTKLVPEQTGDDPEITNWKWIFKDRDNPNDSIVVNENISIEEFDMSAIASTFDVPEDWRDNFEVRLEVQGKCGPAISETYIMQAYEVDPPLFSGATTYCIDDISPATPIAINVTNAQNLTSPNLINGPLVWDFDGLDAQETPTFTGLYQDSVTFSDKTLLQPGTYEISVTLTDAIACDTTVTREINIAAKPTVDTVAVRPINPTEFFIQCGERVFAENDEFEVEFTIDSVLASQGGRIAATFNGNPINFEATDNAAVSGTELVQSQTTRSYVVRLTKSAAASDQLVVTVNNEQFPAVGCENTLTLDFPLRSPSPEIAVRQNLVCETIFSNNRELEAFITNPNDLRGPINDITWTVTDTTGNPVSGVTSSFNDSRRIFYNAMPPGKHVITGGVDYGTGCYEEDTAIVTVAALPQINILDAVIKNGTSPCADWVFEAGDTVVVTFTVENVWANQGAEISVSHNGTPVASFNDTVPQQTAPLKHYTFEVVHTGSATEAIEINSVNSLLSGTGSCEATATRALPLRPDPPVLIGEAAVFCESDFNGGTFEVNIDPDWTEVGTVTATTWTVLDSAGNTITDGVARDSESNTNITFAALPIGFYTIQAEVSFGAGCTEVATVGVSVAAQAAIPLLTAVPASLATDCGTYVFAENDDVTVTFTVDEVYIPQKGRITATYNGSVVFQTWQDTIVREHSFQIVHTGNAADLIEIRVENDSFPNSCPITRTLAMPMEGNPPRAAADDNILCPGENLVVSLTNLDELEGNPTVDWENVFTLSNATATSATYSGLPTGTHSISGVVSHGTGCIDTVFIQFTVVDEAVIDQTEVRADSEVRNCDAYVFSEGEVIEVDFTINDVLAAQGANVFVSYAGQPIAGFNPMAQNTETASYTAQFVHSGNAEDLFEIRVGNATYGGEGCNEALRQLAFPLAPQGEPEIAVSNTTVCAADVSNANPVTVTIENAAVFSNLSTNWNITSSPAGLPFNRLNETATSISLVDLQPGSYTISAETDFGANCSATTNSMTITVLPTAALSIDPIVITDNAACPVPGSAQVGDEVSYTFEVSNIDPNDPTTVTITSALGEQSYENITTSSFTETYTFTVSEAFLQGEDQVTFTVSSQNGCQTSQTVTVPVVQDQLLLSPAQNTSVCVTGTTATLAVNVLSSPSGTPTFLWSGDNVPANSTNQTVTLNGLVEGQTYNVSVTVSNPNCTKTIDFTVNVNEVPPTLRYEFTTDFSNTDCNGNGGYCPGEQVALDFFSPDATRPYTVYVNIPSAGIDEVYDFNVGDPAETLMLTVGDETEIGYFTIRYQGSAETCAESYDLSMPILPLASIIGEDNGGFASCSGEVVREIGVTVECDDYTFDWSGSPNQELIVSDLNSNLVTLDLTGQPSGSYTFEVVVSGDGCSRTIGQTIEYSSNLPDQIVATGNALGFCVGELPRNNVVLSVAKNNDDINPDQLRFDWSITSAANQGFFKAGTDLSAESIVIDIPANTPIGTYDILVRITDRDPDNDCEVTLTYPLQIVGNDQIAVATTDGEQACTYLATTLQASGSLSGSYRWQLVSPVTGAVLENYNVSGESLTVEFEEAGSYTFVVADADDPACIAEATYELTVEECELFVPNVFTPNNSDAINNTFFIERIANKNWTLEVYNRYGDRVYQNNNYDNSWDASDITGGTYYYLLYAPSGNQEYKGWVQIIKGEPKGDGE